MKEKLTIGLFIDTFYPMVDGVITVVDNYARNLINYANVIVFAPEVPGRKFDDSQLPYKVIRCKSIDLPIIDYSLPIPKLDRKFKKELKNIKLDIVHIHSPFTLGKMGINYAKKHNIPVVATMHSQFKQDFYRAVKNKPFANLLTKVVIKQFNRCTECWAVNSEVANIFYNDYKYREMPKVMNNATDMKLVENIEEARKVINERYFIDDDEKVFLFVGRINNLKNVFFIANSLKILKEKCDFKFRMLFVGRGQDEDKLRSLIKKNEMEKEIIMCDRITDRQLLAKFYARADLFLFPSLYDASSIVQIEAASQKTPTLFLEGGATTATITNGVNGYICEGNEEKFADKIIEILKDEALYKEICENAYNQVYVNWEGKIKEVYDTYLKLIEEVKNNK